MGIETNSPPVTGSSAPGCRSSVLSHLNPLVLYDPRSPCAQVTFLWGIVYPIVVAFLVYIGVMIAVFIVAALLGREPSTVLDRVAFANAVSTALTAARLVLGALIIHRRAKDLGWSWLIAFAWLVVAIASLLSLGRALAWVTGAAQVVILMMLLALPGKIARARKASPS